MTLLLAFLAAFALAVLLVPVAGRIARAANLYAYPSSDRWHSSPVPKIGGAAMLVPMLAVPTAAGAAPELAPILITTVLMYGLGLADDLRALRPATKLVMQMAIAAVFLILVPDLRITGWPNVDRLIGFAWIVGITNALNLLDNIDGLAAGVAAIAGTFFVAILLLDGGWTSMEIAVAAMVGAAAGFLLYNFHPASIFMGDGGSHLLGAFLACSALVSAPSMGLPLAPVAATPVVLLLIPIFDLAFVTVARGLAGRSAFLGGRDHTSHRLVALGIGERRAVLVLYALTCAGGAIALGLATMSPSIAWALVSMYAATLGAIGIYLGHIEVTRGSGGAAPPLPLELTARYRLYEIALDAFLLGAAYYLAFVARFRDPQFSELLPNFTRSLPLVVGLQLCALWATGTYRRVWATFSVTEIWSLVRGTLLGVAASVIAVLYVSRFIGYSRSVFAFDALLAPVFVIGARVILSGLDEYLRARRSRGRLALIYGAGRGGALAVRELLQNAEIGLSPLGFIDDDPAKRRLRIDGLPVLGSLDELPALLDRRGRSLAAVVVSTARLTPERFDLLCRMCAERGIAVRRLRFSIEDVPSRDAAVRVVSFPRP